jgi:hypothetical protein
MKVTDDTLNKFVNQTYHWKTLPTQQVLAMAQELQDFRSKAMEADNPDQEQFPNDQYEQCAECFQTEGFHHPACPNA